jgi:hypothetical protein
MTDGVSTAARDPMFASLEGSGILRVGAAMWACGDRVKDTREIANESFHGCSILVFT